MAFTVPNFTKSHDNSSEKIYVLNNLSLSCYLVKQMQADVDIWAQEIEKYKLIQYLNKKYIKKHKWSTWKCFKEW